MSRTKPVTCKDTSFWVYDVALGILFKFLMNRANQCADQEHAAWLSNCIQQWTGNAICPDMEFNFDRQLFDSQLSAEQLQVILRLIDESCLELAKRESISSQEEKAWEKAWNIPGGMGMYSRGYSEFPTAPVVELGRAIQELLCGTLPPAPVGTWWFYGAETGRQTIAMMPPEEPSKMPHHKPWLKRLFSH
jgi:hypothetical protein